MILTLETSEIASHRGDGKRTRPWKKMKEWLFLDGVHIQGDRPAINKSVKLPIPILSDSTNASF
jgi:hypothetical protein